MIVWAHAINISVGFLFYMQQVLETRTKQQVNQQVVIIPKYIVPDTNCFIFDLISIQRLVGSGHFTVVIPLTGTV